MLNEIQARTLHDYIVAAVNALIAVNDGRTEFYLNLAMTDAGEHFQTALNVVNNEAVRNAVVNLHSLYVERPIREDNDVLQSEASVGRQVCLNLDRLGPEPAAGEISAFLTGALNMVLEAIEEGAVAPEIDCLVRTEEVEGPELERNLREQKSRIALEEVEAEGPEMSFEHPETESVLSFPSRQGDEVINGISDAVVAPIHMVLHPISTFQGLVTFMFHPVNSIENIVRYAWDHPLRFGVSVLAGKFYVSPAIQSAIRGSRYFVAATEKTSELTQSAIVTSTRSPMHNWHKGVGSGVRGCKMGSSCGILGNVHRTTQVTSRSLSNLHSAQKVVEILGSQDSRFNMQAAQQASRVATAVTEFSTVAAKLQAPLSQKKPHVANPPSNRKLALNALQLHAASYKNQRILTQLVSEKLNKYTGKYMV